jgi:Uma2 family endonuclease
MVKKHGTYDDLIKLPEHLVGEIIDGELIVRPRPASPHALAGTRLASDLSGPFDRGRGGGPGGWWILFEPELHFGKDVVVPDVTAWRRERMPTMPNVPFFEMAPDWVCEIISPSTARVDRAKKTRLYARAKVAHFWILDPIARTLEVFILGEKAYTLISTHEGDEKIHAQPFDAVELDLAQWWTGPEPAPNP